MRYKGVIFDFNGVLLWDMRWHDQAWRDISKKLRGTPFTETELNDFVYGRSNKDIFSYILGKDLTAKELSADIETKEGAYQKIALSERENFRLSPGAETLLDQLKEKGVPFTIGTSAPEYNMRFYIKHLHLEKWFDTEKIAFDDGTVRGKPAPDIFLRAAEKIGVPISECIVIEDSHAGIEAAIHAKAGKIIGLGPREQHPDLKRIGANKTIETLAEITLQDLE